MFDIIKKCTGMNPNSGDYRVNKNIKLDNRIALIFSVCIVVGFFCVLFFLQNTELTLGDSMSPPSKHHLFGTDIMGRDMLVRTATALITSIWICGVASLLSVIASLCISVLAQWNQSSMWLVKLAIDLFISVPHMLLLIILTLAFGGGAMGVISAVVLTHWPKLTCLLIEEVNNIKRCQFVQLSFQFGQPYLKVLFYHIIPFIVPHCIVGFLFAFPHILIHISGLTFLGFGLEPSDPSIGELLSESSRYLISGHWWLALFPGITLLFFLMAVALIGQVLGSKFSRRGK